VVCERFYILLMPGLKCSWGDLSCLSNGWSYFHV